MNPFFKAALWLMFFLLLISPLVHLLKIIRISVEIGAWTFYVGFPLVTSLVTISVLSSAGKITGALVPSVVLFMLLVGYALLPTIFYGGTLVDIAGNTLRYVFVLSLLCAVAIHKEKYTNYLDGKMKIICLAMLLSSAVSVTTMYWAGSSGLSVYYGLQSTTALLPLSYGLVKRRHFIFLLSAAVIVLSGKRGAMMAALAVFFGYMGLMIGARNFTRPMLLSLVTVSAIAVVIGFGLTPTAVSNRLDFLEPGSEMSFDSISSGRFSEGEHAVEKLQDNPVAAVTGFGLGSAILADSLSYSTIHFSPLALSMQIGVPLAAVFYLFLLYSLARFGLAVLKRGASKTYVIVLLVCLAEVVFSMSAFTILQSYTLWLAFAYLYVWKRPADVVVNA